MHRTHVELEVMRMRGVAVYSRKTYTVLAWDFPEARIKAASKAQDDGYEVIRVISTWE